MIDQEKAKIIDDHEYLLRILLEELEFSKMKMTTALPEQKRKIRYHQDNVRIKYSQILTSLVLFKAKYGLFDHLKRLK